MGWSVSIQGGTLAAGARPYASTNSTTSSGAVYVFAFQPTQDEMWIQQDKVTPRDPISYATFGHSVAVQDQILVVGSFGAGAYVFTRDNHKWVQEAILISESAYAYDGFFGASVALDQGTVVVGAPGSNDDGISGSGAVYVFSQSTTTAQNATWDQPIQLSPQGSDLDYANFGNAVNIYGSTIVVGAWRQTTDQGYQSGAAYVFAKDHVAGETDSWNPITMVTASDGGWQSFFGIAVAIDNGTALIGSRGDFMGSESGSAYSFDCKV